MWLAAAWHARCSPSKQAAALEGQRQLLKWAWQRQCCQVMQSELDAALGPARQGWHRHMVAMTLVAKTRLLAKAPRTFLQVHGCMHAHR